MVDDDDLYLRSRGWTLDENGEGYHDPEDSGRVMLLGQALMIQKSRDAVLQLLPLEVLEL